MTREEILSGLFKLKHKTTDLLVIEGAIELLSFVPKEDKEDFIQKKGETMNTIMIMAEALAKSARGIISRLDIQYNYTTEDYTGIVYIDIIGAEVIKFRITESGEVMKTD